MYKGAQRAIVDWQGEVAEGGSLLFGEAAKAGVFGDLHRAAARLFNALPEAHAPPAILTAPANLNPDCALDVGSRDR